MMCLYISCSSTICHSESLDVGYCVNSSTARCAKPQVTDLTHRESLIHSAMRRNRLPSGRRRAIISAGCVAALLSGLLVLINNSRGEYGTILLDKTLETDSGCSFYYYCAFTHP